MGGGGGQGLCVCLGGRVTAGNSTKNEELTCLIFLESLSSCFVSYQAAFGISLPGCKAAGASVAL